MTSHDFISKLLAFAGVRQSRGDSGCFISRVNIQFIPGRRLHVQMQGLSREKKNMDHLNGTAMCVLVLANVPEVPSRGFMGRVLRLFLASQSPGGTQRPSCRALCGRSIPLHKRPNRLTRREWTWMDVCLCQKERGKVRNRASQWDNPLPTGCLPGNFRLSYAGHVFRITT